MQEEKTEKAEFLHKFSLRLRHALERSGLKQSQLAKRLNVGPSRVGQWCQGKNMPSPEMQTKIADILNTSVDWLFFNRNYVEKHELSVHESKPIYGSSLTLPEKDILNTIARHIESAAIIRTGIVDLIKRGMDGDEEALVEGKSLQKEYGPFLKKADEMAAIFLKQAEKMFPGGVEEAREVLEKRLKDAKDSESVT